MLILLPPSEGKSSPETGKALNLNTLTAARELRDARTIALQGFPALDRSCARPAHEIYSGVLYQSFDWQNLPPAAQARGEKSIIIISALFGIVGINDAICSYKAKIKNSIWRDPVALYLEARKDDLIVDARSSTYQGIWTPPSEKTVCIRVFQIKGGKKSVITHMSKKYRGELVRWILQKKSPTTPEELYEIASQKFRCTLTPAKKKEPWFLDLLIEVS